MKRRRLRSPPFFLYRILQEPREIKAASDNRLIPITGRNDTLAAKGFWCVARRKTDGYLPHQLPLASPSGLLRRLQRGSHRSLLLITRGTTTLTRAKRISRIVSFLMVFGITLSASLPLKILIPVSGGGVQLLIQYLRLTMGRVRRCH